MKKFNYAFLALFFLLAMACKKDPPLPDVNCNRPTNDLILSRQLIIGCWQWHRTVHFFDVNKIITPDSTGDNVRLVFKKNGIVEHYLNGRLNDTSSYEIDIMKKYSSNTGDTTLNLLWIRQINNSTSSYPHIKDVVPIRVCNDSLYLKYESFFYHTGDNYFFRVK